jgi:beta-alanine degradation protein BauB
MIKYGQIGTQLLFENESCRVWHLVLEQGEKSPWHRHQCDYVYVVTKDTTVYTEYENGEREVQNETPIGTAVHHLAGNLHRLVNASDSRYENIIVELKGQKVDKSYD